MKTKLCTTLYLLTLLYTLSAFTQTKLSLYIDGEVAREKSSDSVSLSEDGSRIAIGTQFNSGIGTNYGHARVYDLSDLLNTSDLAEDVIYIKSKSNAR